MTEILLVLVLVLVLVVVLASWVGDFAWWTRTAARWSRKARWFFVRGCRWIGLLRGK